MGSIREPDNRATINRALIKPHQSRLPYIHNWRMLIDRIRHVTSFYMIGNGSFLAISFLETTRNFRSKLSGFYNRRCGAAIDSRRKGNPLVDLRRLLPENLALHRGS